MPQCLGISLCLLLLCPTKPDPVAGDAEAARPA